MYIELLIISTVERSSLFQEKIKFVTTSCRQIYYGFSESCWCGVGNKDEAIFSWFLHTPFVLNYLRSIHIKTTDIQSKTHFYRVDKSAPISFLSLGIQIKNTFYIVLSFFLSTPSVSLTWSSALTYKTYSISNWKGSVPRVLTTPDRSSTSNRPPVLSLTMK